MSVTVRDKRYVIAPGLESGEDASPAEPTFTPGKTVGDLPRDSRRALGTWLSDASLGRAGVGVASVRPITSDTFEETSLRAQPHSSRDQARYALPSSLNFAEQEAETELLLRAPLSTERYVAVATANSSSAESPLSSKQKLIAGARVADERLDAVGALLTADAAALSSPLTPEKLFAVKRDVSELGALSKLDGVIADAKKLAISTTSGQLFSPSDPLSGLTAAAVSSVAATVVSSVAAAAVSVMIATQRPSEPSSKLRFGRSGPAALSLIGVSQTKRDFKLCVVAGLASFFGVQSLSVPSAATVAAAIEGGDAAYKLSLARALVRLAAVSSPSGALALLRAASTFAAIGDAIIGALLVQPVQTTEWLKPAAAAPSLYVRAATLARDAVEAPWIGAPRERRSAIKTVTPRSGKISTADREAFERALDAEYVPFYLHDLRNNEIVSFHAFLSELTDSYSPQWESSEGFGRVDAVHTYKSTARTLSLAFIAVATSSDDFNDMWVKLNKLATLVYPQFDGGRWVKSDAAGTDAFSQPFSQAFSASPIVRLRIGDVIGSNATSLAIKRLFGYGQDGLTISGKRVSYSQAADPQALVAAVRDAASQAGTGYSFFIDPGVYESARSRAQIDTSKLLSKTSVVATVSSVTPDGVIVSISPNISDKSSAAIADVTTLRSEMSSLYVVQQTALRATPETIKKIQKKLAGADADDSSGADSADVMSFFSEQSNAVVRSFRESGGRGLAGKIDSLTMNMLDRTVWDTDVGHRAPTCVQVSLSFTVIHDIAPGLDKSGVQRAALYPLRGV